MIQLKDICVNFAYKKVLTNISIQFEKGKIYSLLGENGAGKSTLAHVLAGNIKPTSGQIFINSSEVSINSPKKAIKMGITCIHQNPHLCSSISIIDNLKLGITREQYSIFKEEKFQNLYKYWLSDTSSKTLIKDLPEDKKFFTALTGTLLKNPDFIILDEPPDIKLEKLKTLTDKGIGIIIITHNLKEAIEKSDEIILLQNGTILQQTPAEETSEIEIKQKLYGISKEVEIPACIKIEQVDENSITHNFGKTGYIPSDKIYKASNPQLSILQLLTAFNPKGKEKLLKEKAENILKKADVYIKLNEKASCLSGGMLQRIILERELWENPEKLFMFNPTHGLDVEATEKLYSRLEKLATNGTQIIFGEQK